MFYLCCKYDDWNFRLNLYKLAVFAGNEKEIKGLQNSYPEILNKLTSDEAASIMSFCLNHSIKYKRLNSQLLALGAVGYFLDDKCFEHYEKTNIDSVSLKIGLQFLYASMGKDVYGDILELMPYIQGDAATTIAVTRLIVEYLETTDTVKTTLE